LPPDKPPTGSSRHDTHFAVGIIKRDLLANRGPNIRSRTAEEAVTAALAVKVEVEAEVEVEVSSGHVRRGGSGDQARTRFRKEAGGVREKMPLGNRRHPSEQQS
jgi:hypothetical protein